METPIEPPKRGRGRPKKIVTEPEIKRKVGRPTKAPAEKTEPKRPVGRPKEEKTEPKRPVGRPKKVILTETTPAGGPAPVVEVRPPPPPIVVAPRPAVTPREREALDRYDAEAKARAAIDLTLPSPPSEVELPSDEEEASRIIAQYHRQEEAKKERDRLKRVQYQLDEYEARGRREREAREEKERKEREARETRERSIAESGFSDPQYAKFRKSFRNEEAYGRWEERAGDLELTPAKNGGYYNRDEWVTFNHERYLVLFGKKSKSGDVYRVAWKRADQRGNIDVYEVGVVGKGEFKDLVLP
jgi:hypothetical protein